MQKNKARSKKIVSDEIDLALRRILKKHRHGNAKKMYEMLEYFLGYRDTLLRAAHAPMGRRFRSNLLLQLTRMFGRADATLEAATLIELFHNFTLIHDDIEDGDVLRRGRPTLWKLFGIGSAINAGDAQLLIVGKLVAHLSHRIDNPFFAERCFDTFLLVSEGQHLDIDFTTRPLYTITQNAYIDMLSRKTGVLVGLAAELAGMLSGRSKKECEKLYRFGMALGIAYQLADDFRSCWGSQASTGKHVHGDIRERKRSLPILLAFAQKPNTQIARLYELPRSLNVSEVQTVLSFLSASSAEATMRRIIRAHAAHAHAAVQFLHIAAQDRAILERMVVQLIPESRATS